MRAFLAVLSLTIALHFTPTAVCVADDAAKVHDAGKLAEQIRGEWVLYRDTPNGKYMTIKQHLGDHTVVTTYDPNNNPVHSHRSEYRLDSSGGIPIYRYRNRTVLLGPNAGVKEERDLAYIFRIDGDRFFEVHGMLPGDKNKPTLIVWERLKNREPKA